MSIELINELHNEAMAHLDRALVLKFGDATIKEALLKEYPKIEGVDSEMRYALDLELKAAKLAEESDDQETRSLLIKSAAAIAFQSGKYKYSLELAESLMQFAPAPIILEAEAMIKTIKNAQGTQDHELILSNIKSSRLLNNITPLRILCWAIILTVVALSIFYSSTANGEPIYITAAAAALLIFVNILR